MLIYVKVIFKNKRKKENQWKKRKEGIKTLKRKINITKAIHIKEKNKGEIQK